MICVRSGLVVAMALGTACHGRAPAGPKTDVTDAAPSDAGPASDKPASNDEKLCALRPPAIGADWMYVLDEDIGPSSGQGNGDDSHRARYVAHARIAARGAIEIEPRGEDRQIALGQWAFVQRIATLGAVGERPGKTNGRLAELVAGLVSPPMALDRAGPELEDEKREASATLVGIDDDSERRIATYDLAIRITTKDFGMGQVVFRRTSVRGRIKLRADDSLLSGLELKGDERWISGPHHDEKERPTKFHFWRAGNVDLQHAAVRTVRIALTGSCYATFGPMP